MKAPFFRGALALAVAFATSASADPVSEANANGAVANSATRTTINSATASTNVPGYTTTPPQASLYSQPSLSVNASAALTACLSTPTDPTCQALLGAQSSASLPRPPIPPTDPSIAAANAIYNNPGSQGVTLSSVYSGCTTTTTLLAPATYDTQSCFTYLTRSLNNPCTNTLNVTVNWVCPNGATSGPTRGVDAVTGAATWTCQMPQVNTVYACGATQVGPYLSTTPPLTGQEVCLDSASGVETLATATQVTTYTTVDASPVVTDTWNDLCAGYEARVPPGYLPPEGDNTPVQNPPPMGGPLDKCERANSTCSSPAATYVINDYPVTRSCWQYTDAFNCVDLAHSTDCTQPQSGNCTQTASSPSCIDWDTTFTTPICTAYETDFTCQKTPATYQTVENCGAQSFCTNGSCFDASYPPDQDFAKTVAFLEASREAGKYLDAARLRVFKGFDNRCVKKLFGLVNCCNEGGTASRSMFTDYHIASAAVGSIGKAAVSSYTYDALFVSDAPDFILTGFEALWGTGYSSGLAGVLGGDLAVSDFVSAIVPGWWTLAIMAIQYSGILSCSQAEQVTAMKRDASLCVYLGTYCSSRLPIIRTCIAQTQTYCCYNSRLARIINEQGLAQVGRGFGSAETPSCDGFSVPELQALDFSRMNLQEFYAEIAPTLPNVAALGSAAAAKVPSCYLGQGKC